MPLTKSQNTQALEHILKNVFGLDDDDPLKEAIDPIYLEAIAIANGGPLTFKSKINPPAPTTRVTTNSNTSAVELFQKGIKRDQSLFPTLKAEQYHDSFEKQAHSQGVADVVGSKYSQSTLDEKRVFQTSKGKEIMRNHQATKDAQATYADLVEHHRKSTAACIEARKILAYITTTSIGDGKFKGTTSEFLTNWTHQMRLYSKLMESSSIFGEDQKIMHHSQVVETVLERRQIKLTADILQVSTKQSIWF
ncbi:hypothetical protein IV203_036432 [Nitzschia inconspicua]|uniref:Uncharacterized protein n=1 Tax=Nitzschia inconspicua TaxID=303405 RepID=A0A9K3K556_9STRA|nr:hypothetical protein IV203_017712 [Nitzschia inconspicua]KAG7361332.1 hypothetical protein IV203_036432 [Nitzschia inconspicua]